MRLAPVVLAWLAASGATFYLAQDYEASPGRPAAAPESWPAGSELRRVPGRASLVTFLHPRCPCSRATIDELEVLLSHCPGRVASTVVFQDEAGAAAGSALWRRAAVVRGVTVVADDGTERRRFGGFTSGETLLYAADGRLLFRGGITAGRGHRGESPGRSAVEAFLLDPGFAPPESPHGPVYGCPLAAEPPSSARNPADDSLAVSRPTGR